ncbi:MAG: M4 family metallopeptidase, partial [Verrucomicrobiota bacterium]
MKSQPPRSIGNTVEGLRRRHCSILPNYSGLPLLAALLVAFGAIQTRSDLQGGDLDGLRYHPLSSAPAVGFAPVQPGPVPVQSDAVVDPRISELSQWLREALAQGHAVQPGGKPAAGASPQTTDRQRAVAKLQQAAGANVEVKFREPLGTPMMIKGNLLKRAKVSKQSTTAPGQRVEEQTAREFLTAHRELLRIDDPENEFVLVEDKNDELGLRHLRFSQIFKELPVWPCELMLHLNRDGDVYLFSGTYIPTPKEVPLNAQLSAEQAIQRILQKMPEAADGEKTKPELIVYGPLDAAPRLAWKFEVSVDFTKSWRVVVDALTGDILQQQPLHMHAAISGSGNDVATVNQALSLWQDGNDYFLCDTSKAMFDPTSAPPNKGRGVILVLDGENKPLAEHNGSFAIVKSTNPNGGWVPDGVGAAWGLSSTFNYYRERFDRNSLDGKGGDIIAIIRLPDAAPFGATYNSQTKLISYGEFNTKFLDVSAHELTHGVTANSGNGGILEYKSQSGALNESMSDIFAEMVELHATGAHDWKLFLPLNGVDTKIRDFIDPGSVINGGRKLPSKMSEYIQLPETAQGDNGGVHVNSSINNHAYYMLVEGLSDPIGPADAEKIFYRALTTHLQKQSQFIDMRFAAAAAAEELFGADSKQVRKVKEAYDAVEIFDAPQTPTPTPIPTVTAPDSTLFLRVEPFFGEVLLGRREAALGDPATGVLFSGAAPQRIAVSGDGNDAIFVSPDKNVGLLKTDGSGLVFADLNGQVHSIAMSPDKSRYAVVLTDELTGQPINQLVVVDLKAQTTDSIKLVAPVADGPPLDIIEFADSMDFLPDGDTLIYDAFARIRTQSGAELTGWGLFAVDLTTKTIRTILDVNTDFDIGNPSLGNARPNLLTHEIVEKKTGVSTIVAVDISTGKFAPVATLQQAGVFGFPAYTGDDTAIIHTQVDLNTATTVSLFRQALEADGITPKGQPALWLADADYAAIYRRGAFTSANQLPSVSITSPSPGQIFTAPIDIGFSVNASDSDGTIAKVEFYIGSEKIAEGTSPPYSVRLKNDNPTPGKLRLGARAIDNLGGVAEATPIEVTIGGQPTGNQPPQIDPIPDRTIALGDQLTVNVRGTDPDAGQTLTYTLEPGTPTGAAINPTTGVLAWTANLQGLGTISMTVRVTDSGSPPMSATTTFNVKVVAPTGANRPPVINPIPDQTVAQGNQLRLSVNGTDPDAGQIL